jgi:V/A-type H+/Na+-transporting ATPase subunit A
VAPWFVREGGARWVELRRAALELLQRGRDLKDIAGLVGPDALQDADRMTLESARVVQELVLGQSAYEPNDANSTVGKTYQLASLALALHERGLRTMETGVRFEQLELGTARRSLAAFRAAPATEAEARLREAELAIERLAGEGIR